MSRPDWGALQQEYIAEYTRSGISPVAWCEARGLNYATARRYIKKTPKNAQTEMCKTAQKSAQKKSAQTAQKRNEKSQEKKPVFDAGLNEGDAEEFSFCPDEFGISDQQAKFAMLVAQGKKPTCKGIWEHPGINQGYFAPTYPQIRDIFYPTVEEVAADWGLNVKINEGNKEVHFYYGRQYRGTTICRSMEKPQTIVGFKIGNALVDELDILPKEKARTAWRKIIARMRYKIDGLRNGIDVTTTPEGFKFVYEQFVKAVREKTELASLYGLVQASTFDNEKNLPADYIPSLLESYPPELIKAYLRGQFTNLTSGTVYHQFDRKLNNCEEVEQPGEPIYIGMDFNVGKMAGIVHVLRLGLPCAVTEIINAYDTPDMIRIIKERFWLYDGNDYRKVREIYIYPDASGDSRKSSNASTTDIAQLKQAGFNVVVNSSNPPVKDRVNSMNAMFCNANGERRYKVNVKRCPLYAESLEQQVWDEKGEPDKKSGNDHPNDAGGYFIVKQFPIVKPTGRVTSLRI